MWTQWSAGYSERGRLAARCKPKGVKQCGANVNLRTVLWPPYLLYVVAEAITLSLTENVMPSSYKTIGPSSAVWFISVYGDLRTMLLSTFDDWFPFRKQAWVLSIFTSDPRQ